ncbi:MAG: polysaccharide biosynthesis tyrosine autokinase [Rhizomicrobium sp.]
MAIDRTASTSALTASAATPAEASFGFADFQRVLDERRSLIRNVMLGVSALTLLVLLCLPTLYSSSAVVMLDQRKNNVADLSSVLSALPTDPSSVQNQIQVLSSRDLAGRVIGKLKLYNDPEFNPALNQNGPPSIGDFVRLLNPANWSPPRLTGREDADYERDAIVSAFLDRLDVSALGLSTSITLTFTSRDPAKAALIANTLADAYTEDQVDTKVAAAREATQWLTDRMHQLAGQVQAGESAIAQYKAAHNLVESGQGSSLVDQQLVAINALLVAAQSDMAEKKATYDRVQALLRSGNTADISQVVSSELIVQLRTEEADLVQQEADLSTRYGPNHPKMIAIQMQKRDLDSKVSQEATRIAGSIASDLAVARAHVDSIEASLARVEKQAAGDDLARVKLNSLEANLASTRTMYESFVTRLRATQDQDDIQNPESRVISRAPIPTAPSSPHRLLFFAASLPAGLMLGVLLALLAERFQAPLPRQDQRSFAEPAAPVMARAVPAPPPVLAELPATSDMRAADFVVDNPSAPYSLALSALLSRVTPGRSGRGRVVALTSPTLDVGKSVVALGLARIAAGRGLRTILLDGNFNRPVIAPAAGFHAVPAGIAELLNGSAPLSRALLRDPRSSAFLLSVARPTAAAQALWTSPKMVELLSYFRQNCDLVIIDAAPALADMPFLARFCDQVVLVAQGRAPQAVLEAAVRTLITCGAPQAGLVVTR